MLTLFRKKNSNEFIFTFQISIIFLWYIFRTKFGMLTQTFLNLEEEWHFSIMLHIIWTVHKHGVITKYSTWYCGTYTDGLRMKLYKYINHIINSMTDRYYMNYIIIIRYKHFSQALCVQTEMYWLKSIVTNNTIKQNWVYFVLWKYSTLK